MHRVRVFLRNPLFAQRAGPRHVPNHTIIIEGQLEELGGGGLRIAAERYLTDMGAILDGVPATLFLPLSKVDHVHYLDVTEKTA